MFSKDYFEQGYKSVKEYTNTATKKAYTNILKLQNEPENDNINLRKLEVNSTTFANLFIYSFLFVIVFGIPQIHTMLLYHLEYIGKDPIWTTLWMSLFSFSVYTYSKFVSIRRHNILRNRIFNKKELSPNDLVPQTDQLLYIPEVPKDGPWNIAFYLTPIILQVGFLTYSATKCKIEDQPLIYNLNAISFILLGLYTLLFYWISKRFYKNRNEKHVWTLMFITMVLLISYYFLTHRNMFSGTYGVGVFDLLIAFLIFLRGLLALIYYLYYKSPAFKDWPQEKLVTTKIGKHAIPVSPKWAFVLLFLLVLFMGSSIYPVIPQYNKIVTLKPTTLSDQKGQGVERMQLEDYAIEWMEKRDNDNPIFLIAAQGGGSRAGFWTSSVLAELHKNSMQNGRSFFYDNCFAISSVSGSSVGASIYLNTIKNYSQNIEHVLTPQRLEDFFTRDFISSSIYRLFFISPIQKIFMWPKMNRNDKLILEEKEQYESLFLDHSTSTKTQTYDTSFPVTHKKKTINSYKDPLFIPNTYNVEKAKKSIISPVSFGKNYVHEDLLSIMLNESKCKNRNPEILTIGSAVNLSQMFPFMSASAIYNSCHYYDGGVYDNSGLSTARDIYSKIAPLRDIHKPESQIILLYIKNGVDKAKTKKLPQSSLATLIKAASGSIFSANTNRHQHKFYKKANSLNDSLIKDISPLGKITLNRWLSPINCRSMREDLTDVFEEKSLLKILQEKKKRTLLPKNHSQSVYFDTNKATLKTTHKNVINNMFTGIKPQLIVLHGFADIQGGKTTKNKKLSQERAEVIKSYILEQYHDQISEDQIEINPQGAIGEEDDANDQLQYNRRVDISFGFYTSDSKYYPAPI